MRLRLPEPVGQVSLELVFLDCDGVIFDTNTAKTEAFRYALASCPDRAVEKLVRHHEEHGGVSRYDKFEHFFRELHAVDDPVMARSRALDRYRKFAQRAYRRTEPLSEALEFVEQARRDAEVHVVSGSDEEGLIDVFEHQGIASLFDGIHGSPTGKVEHLERLLRNTGVQADRSLFVGDGRADFEAARAHSVPFVFLASRSEWEAAERHLASWIGAVAVDDWEGLLEGVRA